MQSVLGRIGAIAGNVSIGSLFSAGASPYLPILLVASFLIFAWLVVLFLPAARGERSGCHRTRSLFCFCCRHCLGKYSRNISTSELFPVHFRSVVWNTAQHCHGIGAGTSFHGDELFLLHESVVTRFWSTQHSANMNVYKSFKSFMLLTLHGVVSTASHSTSHMMLSC